MGAGLRAGGVDVLLDLVQHDGGIRVEVDRRVPNRRAKERLDLASAVGRDKPSSDTLAPRSTLPPPTTTPSAIPSRCAATRSAAKRSIVA